jgi:tetratricopeptide (TPR) repeat protein
MNSEGAMESSAAFISYRRDVSAFIARAVFQDLRTNGYDVFMDVQSLDSGKFDQMILNQIAARPYFLLVLTPGTLDRINDPGDWVRREVEYAIDHARVIVPLMTPGFSFDAVSAQLTGQLAGLSRYNGVEMPHSYFEEAMERLRKRFLKPVTLSLTPAPSTDLAEVQQRIALANDQAKVTQAELAAQALFERALKRPYDDLWGRIEDLTEAISVNPAFAQAYLYRAQCHVKARNFEIAQADFDQAILLDPTNYVALVERGINQTDAIAAIEDFTRALQVRPNGVNARVRRGFAYRLLGEVSKAIADLNYALEIDPNHALAPLIRNYVEQYTAGNTDPIDSTQQP